MAFLFLAFCILNFCVLGVGGKTTSALCPCGLVNCPPCLPSFPLSSPPPLHEVMSSLREHGMLIFTGIGDNYVSAIQKLRMEAPRCLEDAMSVEMEDGSQRFTTGRDSMGSSQPFPPCLSAEVDIVTDAFDKVDTVFHRMLRQQFGQRLDLTVGEAAKEEKKKWENLDTKTHVHVYKATGRQTNATETLPHHTDNGMYVLVTPSDLLHLNAIAKNGDSHVLNTGDDSVILILGTGLTSWLLPGEGLHAAPHALPSIESILEPRSVVARMRVAPDDSTPSALPSAPAFRTHFRSPLLTESGATLDRLKRQREGMGPEDCSLEWMHACGCTMYDILMTWHNGDPIAEVFASSSTDCIMACKNTAGCDGWTFNPQNGWCALKAADQILPVESSGFISGLMLNSPSSSFCCCPYCPNCSSNKQSSALPEGQCNV